MMFFKKKSYLSVREKAIRNYLINELARTVCYSNKNDTSFARGMEKESREILGKILGILGE